MADKGRKACHPFHDGFHWSQFTFIVRRRMHKRRPCGVSGIGMSPGRFIADGSSPDTRYELRIATAWLGTGCARRVMVCQPALLASSPMRAARVRVTWDSHWTEEEWRGCDRATRRALNYCDRFLRTLRATWCPLGLLGSSSPSSGTVPIAADIERSGAATTRAKGDALGRCAKM